MDQQTGNGGRTAGVKDVAAAAGVSLGTVSNVLNRPERVSAATRERVEQAMRELGFVRNEGARQLRAGRSHTLAYVMLDARNPFFTDVAQGIEETAEQHDLSVFLCNSHSRARASSSTCNGSSSNASRASSSPRSTRARRCSTSSPTRGTPVVIVDRVRSGSTHCSVAVDDVLGGRLAVEHLLDLGHAGSRSSAVRSAPARSSTGSPAPERRPPRTRRRSWSWRPPAPHGRRGPQRRRTDRRDRRLTAAHRGVLRQRPPRARAAAAVCRRGGAGARGPRDRRVRRHRLRRRRRGAADLGAPAPT